MKRIVLRLMLLTPFFLALMALPVRHVKADDETGQVKVKVQATIEAIDCKATPPTISVLGLTIDISKARINGSLNRGHNNHDDNETNNDNDTNDDDNETHGDCDIDDDNETHGHSEIHDDNETHGHSNTHDDNETHGHNEIHKDNETHGHSDDRDGLTYAYLKAGQLVKVKSSTNSGDNESSKDNGTLTCADLMVGQVVKVKLASDTSGQTTGLLSAIEVGIGEGECNDEDCGAVKMTAPLQAIDPSGASITVQGLVIDISQVELEGVDDEESEGNSQHIDVNQMMAGQFVELTLASSQPPLAATKLKVKNFTNQVSVEVIDEKGNLVNDEVQVDIAVTVMIKGSSVSHGSGAAEVSKGSKKGFEDFLLGFLGLEKEVLTFQTISKGSLTLNGLPTGQATIVVTHFHDGQKSMGSSLVKVKGNSTKHLRIRLEPVQ